MTKANQFTLFLFIELPDKVVNKVSTCCCVPNCLVAEIRFDNERISVVPVSIIGMPRRTLLTLYQRSVTGVLCRTQFNCDNVTVMKIASKLERERTVFFENFVKFSLPLSYREIISFVHFITSNLKGLSLRFK